MRKDMKHLILASLLVIFPPLGAMAGTYYIDPGCQHNGNGQGMDCASGAGQAGAINTWDISYSCGNSYQGKKGTVWQAAKTVNLNEKACAPETVLELTSYGSGEKPIITGQAIIPNWSAPDAWSRMGSTNIWYIALEQDPRRVWLSAQEYGEAEGADNINTTYRWYYAGNSLYVYATSNPAVFYSAMEGWQAPASIISISNSDYIDIHGLHIIGGRQQAIEARSSDYVNFYDNTVTGTLEIQYTKDIPSTNWDIYSNTFDSLYSAPVTHEPFYSDTSDGVQLRCAQFNTVRNNTFRNITHSAVMIYCLDAGVKDGASYNQIFENYIYHDVSGDFYGRCFGIGGLDHAGGGAAKENLITRNICANQHARSQIAGYNNTISYNIFNGSRNSSSHRRTAGQAIMVTITGPGGEAAGIKILNNTFFDTDEPAIEIDEERGRFPRDIEIKNNIILSSGMNSQQHMGNVAIEVDNFRQITGIAIENNVIYNSGHSQVIHYRGSKTSLEKMLPFGTDTIRGNQNINPLLQGPERADFTLSAQSPAIDSGAELDTLFKKALVPGSTWPAGVIAADQGADGTCWEVGAYIYLNNEGKFFEEYNDELKREKGCFRQVAK
jgi:hypothetical protein